MSINDLMADFMNFERKDIVKQIPCPDDHDPCTTYHCEVVGHFYKNHDFRIDVEDWKPGEDLNQANKCVEKFLKDENESWMFKIYRNVNGEYNAVFDRPHVIDFRYVESDNQPSWALAVCKALLKIKGIEYELV